MADIRKAQYIVLFYLDSDLIILYNVCTVKFWLVIQMVKKRCDSMKMIPTDFYSFTEIGGVGEMIYKAVRFPDYLPEYDASGMIQYATFRMQFSDTAYHSGDECYLRVYVQNYEKALKVVIQ